MIAAMRLFCVGLAFWCTVLVNNMLHEALEKAVQTAHHTQVKLKLAEDPWLICERFGFM